MDKRSKGILYLICAVIAVLFVVESIRPKPVDWRSSYTSGDKIPLGAHVLFDHLPTIFPDHEVQSIDQVPIDFLMDHKSLINSNYIFINDYLIFDQVETDYLLDYAARGNKVFIATSNVVGPLADTLQLKSSSNSFYQFGKSDTLRTRLTNKTFEDRSYVYHREGSYRYFEAYDTLRTKVLGEVMAFNPQSNYLETFWDENREEEHELEEPLDSASFAQVRYRELLTRKTPQVNFLEVTIGKGAIYYNLNPIAYSNYYMLNGKEQYVAESLSYLNQGPVYFDDYGKSGRKVVSSPLRFVLSQPSLTWAYYLAIAGIIVYMVFASKREQRVVPVIKPLKNDTVEFTRTIGNLYYESGDYTSIIEKKILFFLEQVRSQFFINTDKLHTDFAERLSLKSGRPLEQTTNLVHLIVDLKSRTWHTENELKQLNTSIEAFFNNN